MNMPSKRGASAPSATFKPRLNSYAVVDMPQAIFFTRSVFAFYYTIIILLSAPKCDLSNMLTYQIHAPILLGRLLEDLWNNDLIADGGDFIR
jgi:hypothetical protein